MREPNDGHRGREGGAPRVVECSEVEARSGLRQVRVALEGMAGRRPTGPEELVIEGLLAEALAHAQPLLAPSAQRIVAELLHAYHAIPRSP